MPTVLGPPFDPSYDGLPTHMSTEDFTLWLSYRERIRKTATALYFDVRLGGDEALTAAALSPLVNMWYSVNAKRADVLAQLPGAVRIIELRNNAQANAVGRLFTYGQLWRRDPKLPGDLQLELVTNANDRDVYDACTALGIIYTVL